MKVALALALLTITTSSLPFARAFSTPKKPQVRCPLLLRFSSSDYAHTVDALERELQHAHETLKQVEILAARLQEMEAHDPHIADIKRNEPLKQAVAETKAAIEANGSTSMEAKVAFRHVDRLANERHPYRTTDFVGSQPSTRYKAKAIESHHPYNSIVDKELLQESMEAIEKLMTLQHFLQVEQKRLEAEGLRNKKPSDDYNTPGVPWLTP